MMRFRPLILTLVLKGVIWGHALVVIVKIQMLLRIFLHMALLPKSVMMDQATLALIDVQIAQLWCNIIVMGMIVDDAIVVAENISRMNAEGRSSESAAVEGTAMVFFPVVASVLTTCIAFIPLFFFHARFGQILKYIPLVIFFMLGASLLVIRIMLMLSWHQLPMSSLCQS